MSQEVSIPTPVRTAASRRPRVRLVAAVATFGLLIVAATRFGGADPGPGSVLGPIGSSGSAASTAGSEAGPHSSAEAGGLSNSDEAAARAAAAENEDEESSLDASENWHGRPESDGAHGSGGGGGAGGGGGPVDLDPAGPDPGCSGAQAGQGLLSVTPDPLTLPSGQLSGSLSIRNCGDEAVNWTAATKPSVALASAGASLAAHATTELGFTIDSDKWEPGAVDFKIKVSEPGHNHYVDIHAFRPTFGKDLVASNDLSAGPGVGGCGNQCITKALLSTNYTSPNVGLDVATNVPAKVRVYLSTQAPVNNPQGIPWFPGVAAKATSAAGVKTWKTTLSPLQAKTKYHIIVTATDSDGDVAQRVGSFTTITPLDGPGGLKNDGPPPGCSYQCLTKAQVVPGEGTGPAHLSVKSHTPAQFQASLSTAAPKFTDGVPSFDKADVWKNSGLSYAKSWEVDIEGLQPGTKYFAIVMATDANQGKSYTHGSFRTHSVNVLVTLHKIHLTYDGDSGKYNRGELSFAWGVGDDTVGIRGEEKMHAGTDVKFNRPSSQYVVNDAKGFLPTVFVDASERDADGLGEFCTMGIGVAHLPGSNGDCDAKWNVASSGLMQVDNLANLPGCASFGVQAYPPETRCLVLESDDDLGDDYPRFWTLVSFLVTPAT